MEPSKQRGRSRWNSGGRSLSYELARAYHDVLAGAPPAVQVSRRAQGALEDLRGRHDFVSTGDRTYLVPDSSGRLVWWTFAGFAANSGLAEGLSGLVDADATVGDMRLRLAGDATAANLRQVLDERAELLVEARPQISDAAVEALKFSAALPIELARATLSERLTDPGGVLKTLSSSTRQLGA